MSAPQHSLFTVGHSNHSPEAFTGLLLRHGVEEVFDVRSSPYSRYTPQFNQGDLTGILSRAGETGIEYTFLGAELGGRPADRSCYDADGRVLYERLADTDLFDDGIRRIVRAADERRAVLMCSEKEPLDCHRALLIARVTRRPRRRRRAHSRRRRPGRPRRGHGPADRRLQAAPPR